MVDARVPLKAEQERLRHTRPDILSQVCSLGSDLRTRLTNQGLYANWLPYWLANRKKVRFIGRAKLLRRCWRRGSGSNRRIKVLQTYLPVLCGYVHVCMCL